MISTSKIMRIIKSGLTLSGAETWEGKNWIATPLLGLHRQEHDYQQATPYSQEILVVLTPSSWSGIGEEICKKLFVRLTLDYSVLKRILRKKDVKV